MTLLYQFLLLRLEILLPTPCVPNVPFVDVVESRLLTVLQDAVVAGPLMVSQVTPQIMLSQADIVLTHLSALTPPRDVSQGLARVSATRRVVQAIDEILVRLKVDYTCLALAGPSEEVELDIVDIDGNPIALVEENEVVNQGSNQIE